MALTLSDRDIEEVQGAIDCLGNPAGCGSVTTWRAAVSDRLCGLLGGDHTLLYGAGLEPPGDTPVSVDPVRLGRMRAFLVPATDAEARRAAMAAGIDTFATREFRRIVGRASDGLPANTLHVIGLASWGPAGDAYLSVLRTRRDEWRFGEATRSVARLLLPAFRAGVAALTRAEGHATEPLNWLEAARDSTAIYDLQGKVPLAANTQFAGLQGSTDDGDALDQAIAELADQLRPEGGRPGSRGSFRKRVSLSGGDVTVQATWVSEAMPLPAAGILVRVVPDHPLVPPAAELAKRHGLSAREAEVAARLADGAALHSIGEALGISPHTARHHAEAAFKKLGVHSRGELIRVLLGTGR